MQIQAVVKSGLICPLEPLNLPEGELIEVIVMPSAEKGDVANAPAQILARIAAFPLEGTTDNFSGQDHDRILYSAFLF
jgi:predicted DNA-binding antitoxin AbrB/MazE fold protein